MTFVNPLLQNYTAHEKSADWPSYSPKVNNYGGTPLNISNESYYQQTDLHTMTILDNQPSPESPQLPNLELDMEMFSDLSTYCHTSPLNASPTMPNNQGELSTPTFELRAPLDFDRRLPGSDKAVTTLNDQSSLKVKSELSESDNINLENSVLLNDDIFTVGDHHRSSLDSCSGRGTDSSIVIENSNPGSDLYSPTLSPEEVGYYYPTQAPVKTEIPWTDSCDGELPSNTNCTYLEDELITDPAIHKTRVNFPTPESSRGSSPILRLDVGQRLHTTDTTLQTPDIIDAFDVIDSEKDFNILNFINDEDIKVAADLFPSIQDLTVCTNTSLPEKQPTYILPPSETHTYALPPRTLSQKKLSRKRRIKREEDDDEDYVPPSSYKPRSKSRSQKKLLLDVEIDKHILEQLNSTSRRGRPPKSRLPSVSSDSTEYLDSEEAKYREMRDKNNEASRRSRFKRKLKEKAIENEAEELAEKNIRLKAQVEELERTVNTFRNNLLKLLLVKH